MVDYGSFEDGVRFASLADEIECLHTRLLFVIGRDESLKRSALIEIRQKYDEYSVLAKKYEREVPQGLTKKFEDSLGRR